MSVTVEAIIVVYCIIVVNKSEMLQKKISDMLQNITHSCFLALQVLELNLHLYKKVINISCSAFAMLAKEFPRWKLFYNFLFHYCVF